MRTSGMIAIAAGIACVAWMPQLPHYALLLALAAGVQALPWQRLVTTVMLVLAGSAYGVAYGHYFVAGLLPPELETRDIVLDGRIVSLPDFSPHRGGTYRFDFKVDGATLRDHPCCEHLGRVRLSFQSARAPARGERWRFTARLKRPRGFANPGAFDYARWLVARGIHASGYVRDARLLEPSAGVSRGAVVRHLRGRLADKQQRGVLLALAVGDRAMLSDQHWELFRRAGISHLMAISGLHIGIAAGLGLLIGRLFQTLAALAGRDQPLWPYLISGALALVYAWLAGLSLPTLRSLIMVATALLALSADRLVDRWQVFAAALLLVLLIDPLASLQTGFWLSFTAVAVLLACAERGKPLSLLRAQWVLLLGLMPLTALFFQQFSLLSLPVNLILVPVFSLLVVPLVLLALAAEGVVTGVAELIWQLTDTVLAQCLGLLESVLARSSHWVWPIHLSPTVFASTVAGAALLLLPRALPGRYLGLVCLLPLLVVGRAAAPLEPGNYRLTALDVGQGLAVVVETAGHVLVYDVGPRYSPRLNMAEAAVLPYLRSHGLRRVDTLVISHADADHAGAYQKLLEELPVERVLAGEPLPGSAPCAIGQRWHWDGIDFEMLGPRPASSGEGNNRSCVLLIRSGKRVALLPGDIDAGREQALLPLLRADVDVLLAPHHGSKTSSSSVFVGTLAPELVIFSAGYKHHFGHPAPEVVARYQRVGANILETAHEGAITVTAGPNGILNIDRYREQHSFYWNQVPD